MHCEKIREQLGPYLDGELAPEACVSVRRHMDNCPACCDEFDAIRGIAEKLASPTTVATPETLWSAISDDLETKQNWQTPVRIRWPFARGRIPAALVAAITLAVGLGFFSLAEKDSRVQAAVVDFGVLLDALPLDPHKAFRKFLVRYDAKRSFPMAAKRYAPHLDFEIPDELPGGFVLKDVYVLRFGDHAGVAVSYARGAEFLATIFHPPVEAEDFGTHRDYPCVIGKHRGHKAEVGEWKLVHVTDPTTCHCVLSRLSEESELPDVLAAVAPRSAVQPGSHHH